MAIHHDAAFSFVCILWLYVVLSCLLAALSLQRRILLRPLLRLMALRVGVACSAAAGGLSSAPAEWLGPVEWLGSNFPELPQPHAAMPAEEIGRLLVAVQSRRVLWQYQLRQLRMAEKWLGNHFGKATNRAYSQAFAVPTPPIDLSSGCGDGDAPESGADGLPMPQDPMPVARPTLTEGSAPQRRPDSGAAPPPRSRSRSAVRGQGKIPDETSGAASGVAAAVDEGPGQSAPLDAAVAKRLKICGVRLDLRTGHWPVLPPSSWCRVCWAEVRGKRANDKHVTEDSAQGCRLAVGGDSRPHTYQGVSWRASSSSSAAAAVSSPAPSPTPPASGTVVETSSSSSSSSSSA